MSEPRPKTYHCFELVRKGTKNPALCCVKFCRNAKIHDRKICHNHKMKAWRLANPLKAAYATLRDHARRRRVNFTLTLEQYEMLITPSDYLNLKGHTREDLHLDRIDPLRGYEFDNLQILTCSENSAKGATKDKKRYVAERLARIAAMNLAPADDPGDLEYSPGEGDDPF